MSLLTLSLRRRSFLAGVLLAAAAAGCHTGEPPPEEPAPQAPVHARAAKRIVMGEWTELLGTTQPLPNHSARVSTTVEGHVLSVLGDGKSSAVVEGQQVDAGQVIVQLDDSVLRANHEKLEAVLKDLEQQQHQAGYALDLATIDVNRLQELLKGNSAGGSLPLVSRVELEKAQVLQMDARSKLEAVAAKQAGARADLKAVDRQMEFYTLRAPIPGRLGIVQAVPGQTLNPGTVVAEVMDLEQIDVLCHAPPDAAARLALDQSARLLADESAARDGTDFLTGQVAFVGVQAQPETGNVAVKVRFPNPNCRLRAHTIARVRVLTQPERERLTIPEAALMEDRAIPTVVAVQVVKAGAAAGKEPRTGKARKLEVRVGIRERDRGVAEVLGLTDPTSKDKVDPEGLLFVTAGGHGLQNDDMVRLQDEEPREPK